MIQAIEQREREERIRQGYLSPDSQPQRHASLPSPPSSSSTQWQSSSTYPRIQRPSRKSPPDLNSSPDPVPPSNSTTGRGNDTTYPVPTPASPRVAPPGETVDPSAHASKDDLRRLAERDTKRRIAESDAKPPEAAPISSEEPVAQSRLQPSRRG